MRALLAAVVLLGGGALAGVVACGALDAGALPDGGGNSDANHGCQAFISFDPAMPTASPGGTVRAIANLDGFAGVPTYTWHVTFANADVSFTIAQADGSAIEFAATDPGAYDVRLDLTGPTTCPFASATANVQPEGATKQPYRLRVRGPAQPPQEKAIMVPLGTPSFAFGPYPIEAGKAVMGVVTHGATKVPAYVRLVPTVGDQRDEIVEAFADGNGVFAATILDQAHEVLVIPALPGIPPQKFTRTFGSGPTPFALVDGLAIAGTVSGPSGAPLAGAHVQLMLGDTPSTLTTTAADGTFSVQAVENETATVTVDVTPPDASGLPRLTAGLVFDQHTAVAISYASTLAPRELAGAHVMRGAAALANARVTLVGTIANAGTITAGTATAVARGIVHVAAVADADGALPSLKAAPVALSAVVEAGAGDYAVATVNLVAVAPTTIVAPAPTVITTALTDGTTALRSAILDVAPVGELALAGLQPTRLVADATGQVSISFAAGGRYDLRAFDPQGRVAPRTFANLSLVAPPPALLTLPAATVVTGQIVINVDPVPAALVQILCATCTGVDRTRPIAEVITDANGRYHYAVAKTP